MLRRRFEYTPIGLDIDPRRAPVGAAVRAAQFRRDRRAGAGRAALELVAAAHLTGVAPGAPAGADRTGGPRRDEVTPGWIASVLAALARQGFVGDRVVLHMPHRRLLTGPLEVPPRASGAPLDLICRNELARVHRVDPAEIECGWWELPAPVVGGAPSAARETDPAGGAGAQVLAIGCRTADAEDLVAAFETGGAEVAAIDARGPALTRACLPALPDPPALGAMVEWDWDSALIVIVRGGVPVYERVLAESGLESVLAMLVRKLALEDEVARHVLTRIGLGPLPEALADDAELIAQAQRIVAEHLDSLALEVRASAAYAVRRFGGEVPALLFCGEGALTPGASDRLARHLDTPPRPLIPREVVPFRGSAGVEPADGSVPGGAADSPALAVALGLAAFPTEALA